MTAIVVFLYDKTGNAARPWIEAGYSALIVDLQHKPGLHTDDGRLFKLGCDLRSGFSMPVELQHMRVAFSAAFPPCDHLAVSGARWFKGKGLRKLALAIDLFATAAEVCEELGAPYFIENPVSTISTYWRKADHSFQPHWFTKYEPSDNYNKQTNLWVGGGFTMPAKAALSELGYPDDRIHRCPPPRCGATQHTKRYADGLCASGIQLQQGRRFCAGVFLT